MNKLIKKILVLSFSIILLLPNSTSNAVELNTFDINEVEVSLDQFSESDGITIYVTFDQKGNVTKKETFTGHISIPQTKNTADGVLEWAIFHLGFKDWTTDNGDLYYTATCDEPMYSASCNAYVKSTNILFPSVYYNGNFSNLMYSSANTSRAITYNINTDNEETVRVGFKNVVIITVADEYAYIPDASALVDR